MLKIIGFVGVFLALAAGKVWAQETCVLDQVAAKQGNTQLGIAPPDVELLVQEVAQSIGLTPTGIMIVPCDFTEKVQAWYSPGPPEVSAPNGDYILYQPKWVEEVIGSNRWQAVALFGHELGHLLGRHFTSNRDLPTIERETDADRFAGCAVGRLGGKWTELADLLTRLRPKVDGTYPGRERSLKAARKGFDSCGGKDPKADDDFSVYNERDPREYLTVRFDDLSTDREGNEIQYTVVVKAENSSPVSIAGTVRISLGYYRDCENSDRQFEHHHYEASKFVVAGNSEREIKIIGTVKGTVSNLFGQKCGGLVYHEGRELRRNLVQDIQWRRD